MVGTQILFASRVQAAWGFSDFLPFLSHVIPRSTRWRPLRALPATVASPPRGSPSTRERTSSSVPRSAVRRSSRAAGPPVTSSCTRRRSKVSQPPPPEALPVATCHPEVLQPAHQQARGQRAEAGLAGVARLGDPGGAGQGGPSASGMVLETFLCSPHTEHPLGVSSCKGGREIERKDI